MEGEVTADKRVLATFQDARKSKIQRFPPSRARLWCARARNRRGRVGIDTPEIQLLSGRSRNWVGGLAFGGWR